jgi:hypothetical protein
MAVENPIPGKGFAKIGAEPQRKSKADDQE